MATEETDTPLCSEPSESEAKTTREGGGEGGDVFSEGTEAEEVKDDKTEMDASTSQVKTEKQLEEEGEEKNKNEGEEERSVKMEEDLGRKPGEDKEENSGEDRRDGQMANGKEAEKREVIS